MRTSADAIRSLISQPRHGFGDTFPSAPGAYGVFFTNVRSDIYGPLSTAHWPVYVGSTTDLARRINEHRQSVRHGTGIELGEVSLAYLEASHRAEAGLVESLIVYGYPVVWNTGRFSGFGSKDQGNARAQGQEPTKWDRIHPGRPWTRTDDYPGDDLRCEIAEFVTAETPNRCQCQDGSQHPEVLPDADGDPVPWHVAQRRRAYGSVRGAVTGLLHVSPGRMWSSSEVAAELGLTNNHASSVLSKLTLDGAVRRVAKGTYATSPGPPAVAERRLDVVAMLGSGAAVCVDGDTVWLARRLDTAA